MESLGLENVENKTIIVYSVGAIAAAGLALFFIRSSHSSKKEQSIASSEKNKQIKQRKDDFIKSNKNLIREQDLIETKLKNVQTIYFDKNDVMYTQEEVRGLNLSLTKMVVKTSPSEKPSKLI